MKISALFRGCLRTALFLTISFFSAHALALTAGQTYTVTIEKLTSAGAVTSGSTSLNLSTTATANADGKISFSIGGIPNNDSCNFLVVTVADSSGITVRRSIVPCPDTGKTLPLGVSGITDKQTDALLSAFASAGTDDPILAVFGFTIVRSSGMTASDLAVLAGACNQGINASGGFLNYLSNNGVTSAQLAAYRTNIVSRLADPDTGYSKSFKESVDVASSADTTLEAAKRGEAAGKLLKVLVQAATSAGFSQDRVLEAFNAMGSVVMPILQAAGTAGTLSSASKQGVDSSIGGGIQKLRADRGIEKYSQALTSLGATGGDVTSFTTAASTLVNAMQTAFSIFEKVFTGSETAAQVSTAQSTLDAAMQSAFSTFMTGTAASNSRITTMIANIDSALGASTGLAVSNFQFYKSDGTSSNWPIMMVIPTDWVSSIVAAGGSVTYTRDTTAIPAAMIWLGTCSNGSYTNSTTCTANGATWTAARTSFVGMPTSYATLFKIQEDVMILEFTRFAAQNTAGSDMSLQQALEKSFSTSLATLAGNIGGTTNGSTAVGSTAKSALVTLMQSPQF
ncbi:MAG: hypothetical protein NUV34_00610 [Sulfuricaulis sp.]|nr:hypothetical protein [Sulfuricaulis sp.]